MPHNHTYIDLLDDAELLYAVEWVTFLVAFGLILTIIPVARHLYKTGHTSDFPYWVYVISFINSYALALYSAVSDCFIMIFLNVTGMIIYGGCMLVYIYVTKRKFWPILKLLATIAASLAIRHYVTHVAPPSEHGDFLGSLSMTTTAITLLPPLMDVNYYRRQQSCHGMPVAMSVFNFIACICWTVYGKLLDDPYTYLPNITGFIGTATYLFMAVRYGFPDPHKRKTQ